MLPEGEKMKLDKLYMFKGSKKELVKKYGAQAASGIWNKANAEYEKLLMKEPDSEELITSAPSQLPRAMIAAITDLGDVKARKVRYSSYEISDTRKQRKQIITSDSRNVQHIGSF